MGRFIYRLQSILEIKEKLEGRARQEYALAVNLLDQELSKLDALTIKKRAYEDEGKRLLAGALNVRHIRENEEAIKNMDLFIATQEKIVADRERRVQQAMWELEEVMKERKTYESLREKALEEFQLEEGRAESKQVDELTSYTYGLRQKERN
ncbi:MAG: flagellar export protein FliJ [Clostridium sp.]|jgi:flagellar FliJ protein|nr:flagellar export protein FliJ [Clostridium sp.]